jgi:4-amino-4-deoxy-L-arabinose transferase-like glycosyltransferase
MKQKLKTFLKDHIPLVLVLVFFIALCTVNYFRSSWFDESFSSYLVRGNIFQITDATALDVHPPLYYYFLRIWALVFGNNIVALRAMSTLFGVITLIFTYLLLKRWSKSNKTATFLTFMLSLCPFFIYYSGEARMYSMSFAIIMVATYVLDFALKKRSKKYWVLYALTFVAALYTHYFTAFAFVAHFIYIIYYFKKNGFDKNFLLVYPLVVLAYIPWIPVLLNQIKAVRNGFWIPDVDFDTVVRFFTQSIAYLEFYAKEPFQLTVFCIALVAVLIGIIIVFRKCGKLSSSRILELVLLVFVPPLVMAALSLRPNSPSVYVPRYITYSMSLLWALIGIVIVYLDKIKKILAVILFILMATCSGIGIYNIAQSNLTRSEVEIAMAAINDMDKEETPIIYATSSSFYFDAVYYAPENHYLYISNITSVWGSIYPIKAYNMHYTTDPEAIIEKYGKAWIFTGEGVPDVNRALIRVNKVGDYELTQRINYDYFTVLKIEKNEK